MHCSKPIATAGSAPRRWKRAMRGYGAPRPQSPAIARPCIPATPPSIGPTDAAAQGSHTSLPQSLRSAEILALKASPRYSSVLGWWGPLRPEVVILRHLRAVLAVAILLAVALGADVARAVEAINVRI